MPDSGTARDKPSPVAEEGDRAREIGLPPQGVTTETVQHTPREIEQLQIMLEGSEEALWLVSAEGEILKLNGAAERLSGLRKEDVIGRTVGDCESSLHFASSLIAEVISRQVSVTQVLTLGDGKKVLVSGRPAVPAAGGPPYAVLSVRDISETSRLITRLQETTRLSDRYRRELRHAELRRLQAGRVAARSRPTRAAWDLALKFSAVNSPVLLLGETGSGKGVFAKLIHQSSARAAGPFLEVNCGAIPETLIEAELFGYARGAFTGADAKGKAGLVELAHGGSLLLDEIGDLPFSVQAKLLRFLEDGEIWPVGGVRGKRPDARILAATHRDLAGMVAEGTFRRDLFYRLNVLTLHIPPLRERPEDIPPLVEMMLSALEERHRRRRTFTPAALSLLAGYAFPGNVRELWNVVERLVVTVDAETIDVLDLPREVAATPTGRETWQHAVQGFEVSMLREALERYGTQELAARHLGLSQATISRKARRYGLT